MKRNTLIRLVRSGVLASALLMLSPLLGGHAAADGGSLGLRASPAPSEDVVLSDFTPQTATRGPSSADTLTSSGRATTGPNAADSFKGGPGCSIQCITSGIAYARGVDAELVVQTDTAAKIWISVWNDDGYASIFNSNGNVMTFNALFDDLEPGTTYQAMAVAEDTQGYTSYAYGSFTTLNRHVQVTFVQANLEAKPFDGNDFSGYLWLKGGWYDGFSDGPYDVDGDTIWLGINIISLENVDRYLDLSLQLLQQNPDGDLCEASYLGDSPANWSEECSAWAYATLYDGDNDLDERPADATSWTEHTLERMLFLPGGNALPPGFGEALDFTVPVTLHVTYE